jgi:ATP-dependent helicase/nuclease subunit A
LGGAKVLNGESDSDVGAALRGTALHLLLEHLPQHPQTDWPRISARLIPDANQHQDVYPEAVAVLTHPALAHVFAKDTLSEVAITAPLFAGQMLGAIDRLIVSDTDVLAVDFKSNKIVPKSAAQVPGGLLRQMGAYAAALAQIYPNHLIQTAILWTATAQLMPLDSNILQAELSSAATS